METLRVGIVGLGLAATPHLKGYQSHPRAEVSAICDLDEARALRFADEHGIEEVYTDFTDFLEGPRLISSISSLQLSCMRRWLCRR